MKKNKIIAFIPARSGSKRIKHKNIKLINDEPLIYWSVKSAIDLRVIDKVIFSTDTKKYITILKRSLKRNKISDKKIIYTIRSKKDSSSKTKIFDYIKEKLSKSKLLEGYDILVQLLPTAPLRKKSTIKKIIDTTIKKKVNIFTVSKYNFHVKFALEIKKNFKWKPLFINSPLKNGNTRGQDQKTYYKPNPVANCLWIKNLNNKSRTIYERAIPFVTRGLESLDIDTLEDLKLARLIKK